MNLKFEEGQMVKMVGNETWVAACTIARQLSDIEEILAEELGMELEKEAPIDPVL